MARKEHKATPKVMGGWLYSEQEAVKLDTPAWITWLAAHATFYLDADGCTFTARREQRAHGFFWYAYRRYKGTLYKTYLGKAEELTAAHLQACAYQLADRAGV